MPDFVSLSWSWCAFTDGAEESQQVYNSKIKTSQDFFFSRRKQKFSGTIRYGRCYSENYFVALMFGLCLNFACFEF